jgi:hypothetical protein
MSGAASFLARWSRRKREAAAPQHEPARDVEGAPAPSAPTVEVAPEIPLPPIESINGATDLKPFLASSVPAAIAQAALRRAWTADPAIRDFVGLAENAWDFTAPDGVPGFGALTDDDVRRLVAALARAPDADEAVPARLAPAPAPASAPDPTPGPELVPPANNAAPQHENHQQNMTPSHSIRRHGGALPQ